jgi:hypothetical protein
MKFPTGNQQIITDKIFCKATAGKTLLGNTPYGKGDRQRQRYYPHYNPSGQIAFKFFKAVTFS